MSPLNNCSRRAFLSASAASLAAPRLLAARPAAANDKFTTLINMLGGNDALNTLIPTRLQAYGDQRPTLKIAPGAGLSLDAGPYPTSDYVLHPSLRTLARLYRAGSVAFVRLVGYPTPNQSHFLSQAVWSRGYRADLPPDSGWIARYKDIYAPDPISVVALGLGGQLDFLGGTTPSTFTLTPLAGGARNPYEFRGDIRYPANDRLRHQLAERIANVAKAEAHVERARLAQVAMYEQQRRARGVISPPPPVRPVYPTGELGFVLSESAMMLRREQAVKIFYALGGNAQSFDTHYQQGTIDGRHATSLRIIDEALDPYATELQQMGVWNRAAIVLLSEFGRRNRENGDGTDHGDAGLMILVGGAIRGGMYGPDLTEAHVRAGSLPLAVDFRTVYEEMLARHFEVDSAPVFTEAYARQPALGLFL